MLWKFIANIFETFILALWTSKLATKYKQHFLVFVCSGGRYHDEYRQRRGRAQFHRAVDAEQSIGFSRSASVYAQSSVAAAASGSTAIASRCVPIRNWTQPAGYCATSASAGIQFHGATRCRRTACIIWTQCFCFSATANVSLWCNCCVAVRHRAFRPAFCIRCTAARSLAVSVRCVSVFLSYIHDQNIISTPSTVYCTMKIAN